MSETMKFPNVPFDALINIEVSGLYLKRCQTALISFSEQLGVENIKLIFEKMKEKKEPETVDESIMYILLPLIDTIEKAADKQGKVQYTEMTSEQVAEVFKNLQGSIGS